MCGWCHEQIALSILEREKLGENTIDTCQGLDWYFYLRELPSFCDAFKKFADRFTAGRIIALTDLPEDVVIARASELLLSHGYASAPYQQLLRQPIFRRVLERGCSRDHSRKFTALAETLGVEALLPLYQASTYLDGMNVLQAKPLRPMLTASVRLLRHYGNWWLVSEDAVEAEDESFALWPDGDDTSDIEDPQTSPALVAGVQGWPAKDEEDFKVLSRSLVFAIHMVGRYRAGFPLLREICLRVPRQSPDFIADDLWLQRLAARALYGLKETAGFRNCFAGCRATLLYDIDLTTGLTEEDKDTLLQIVQENPRQRDDGYINIPEWLAGIQQG